MNAILPTMDDDSDFALLTALEQAGVKLKAALLSVGYEPALSTHPHGRASRGRTSCLLPVRFSLPNAGTEQMAAALTKYAHFTKSEFPSYGQDLVVARLRSHDRGLQRAGQNPSRASVVKALRGIKSYNGNGLLPISINYSTRLRSRPTPVCLGPAGPEVGLCADLVEAILWDGLRGHEHSNKFVEDTKRGSRRRRIEGRSDLQTPPTEV